MVIQNNQHFYLRLWDSLVCLDSLSCRFLNFKVCDSNLTVEIMHKFFITNNKNIYFQKLDKMKNNFIYAQIVQVL